MASWELFEDFGVIVDESEIQQEGLLAVNETQGHAFLEGLEERYDAEPEPVEEPAALIDSDGFEAFAQGSVNGGVGRKAGGWDEVSVEYAARVEPFTVLFGQEILKLAALSSTDRLLDMGSGPGQAIALPAASICQEVCAVDNAPSMLRLLEQSCVEKGIKNIVIREADGADCGGLKDFDVAVSNFGVIFFSDMVAGLTSMRNALIPGGRSIVSAWGGPSETPAFTLIPSVARLLFGENAVPTSDRPNASSEFLKEAFAQAGFEAIEISGPHSRDVVVGTPEDFWDRFALGAPGTRKLLSLLHHSEKEALRGKVVEKLRADFGSGPVKLAAAAYFASGRRPSA